MRGGFTYGAALECRTRIDLIGVGVEILGDNLWQCKVACPVSAQPEHEDRLMVLRCKRASATAGRLVITGVEVSDHEPLRATFVIR